MSQQMRTCFLRSVECSVVRASTVVIHSVERSPTVVQMQFGTRVLSAGSAGSLGFSSGGCVSSGYLFFPLVPESPLTLV